MMKMFEVGSFAFVSIALIHSFYGTEGQTDRQGLQKSVENSISNSPRFFEAPRTTDRHQGLFSSES